MTEFYALLYNTHTHGTSTIIINNLYNACKVFVEIENFFLKRISQNFFPRTSRKHKKILIFLDMKLGLIKGKITKPYS